MEEDVLGSGGGRFGRFGVRAPVDSSDCKKPVFGGFFAAPLALSLALALRTAAWMAAECLRLDAAVHRVRLKNQAVWLAS